MAHIKTKAFILRTVPYGENRRILDVLTEEGKILTLSCQKTKKMSAINAISQAFIYAELEIFSYKNRLQLDNGDVLYSFQELQEDWDKLAAAAHFAEVYLDALRDHENMPQAFELWAYVLYRLSKSEAPLFDVRVAQFRFLSDLGFQPWLYDCLFCHKECSAGMAFSFPHAGIVCDSAPCRQKYDRGKSLSLSQGLLKAMRYIVNCAYKSLFGFALSDRLQKEFIEFSDHFLTIIMEKSYKRLQFGQELLDFSRLWQSEANNDFREEEDEA